MLMVVVVLSMVEVAVIDCDGDRRWIWPLMVVLAVVDGCVRWWRWWSLLVVLVDDGAG